MGWNDRLLEDPYVPTEEINERDSHENWQMYLEYCRQEELASQNIYSDDIPELSRKTTITSCRDLMFKLLGVSRGKKSQENKNQKTASS